MISLDTETTGIDFWHGTRPFLVTMCEPGKQPSYWEWDVDPLTRRPHIPDDDLNEIAHVIRHHAHNGGLLLQNAKFDARALDVIGLEFPWDLHEDTLAMAHVLYSNRPKDLTNLAAQWLGADIQPFEDATERAVQACRRWARGNRPDWAIAKEGRPDMPSCKQKTWKYDLWLPRAVCLERAGTADELPDPVPHCAHDWDPVTDLCGNCGGHRWWVATSEYANADSVCTANMAPVMLAEVRRRGLEPHYRFKLGISRIIYQMEQEGVTASVKAADRLTAKYSKESEALGRRCVALAKSRGHDLELPRNGVNRSLRTFMLGVLGLEPVENPKARSPEPTLNKAAMAHYLATTDAGTAEHEFVTALLDKRARDTALQYMDAYRRFWVPFDGGIPLNVGDNDYRVLHPSLNQFGSDTLRCTSQNPNEQNIGKNKIGEKGDQATLREVFGFPPWEEGWSMDARGIEDRIPAYESKQDELIAIFECPDAPPFYGSNHFLRFSIVYPDLWEDAVRRVGPDKAGPYIKKEYADTYYQWCKNGGFGVQYGAVLKADGWGTADRAFHKRGAHQLLVDRLGKLADHNRWCIAFANRHGYIETIPDRTVCPERGYPLLCTRTEFGKILETVPLNYRTQGSAMWWTLKAMSKTAPQLAEWSKAHEARTGRRNAYRIAMQVHDEIVFVMPRAADPRTNPKASNLGRARILQRLMASCGDDFTVRVPTPVSVEYHPDNWGAGVSF